MHKGVLRDIAKEQQESLARDAKLRAAVELAAPAPLDPAARVCEGDICDLVQTRFRDPVTGKVYQPGVAATS